MIRSIRRQRHHRVNIRLFQSMENLNESMRFYQVCVTQLITLIDILFVLGNLHYLQVSQNGPLIRYDLAKKVENYVRIFSIPCVH